MTGKLSPDDPTETVHISALNWDALRNLSNTYSQIRGELGFEFYRNVVLGSRVNAILDYQENS